MDLVTPLCVYRAFGFGKGNRKTEQCRQLSSKGLRAGDADFGTARVGMTRSASRAIVLPGTLTRPMVRSPASPA